MRQAMKSGRSARRKGHSFERYVARMLRHIDPDARTARQVAPLDDYRGRDIVTKLPISIQCKAGVRINALAAFQEARAAARPGEIPIAALHDTRRRLKLALIPLDWLVELLRVPAMTTQGTYELAGAADRIPGKDEGQNPGVSW